MGENCTKTYEEWKAEHGVKYSLSEAVVANTADDKLPLNRKEALIAIEYLRQKAISNNSDSQPYFINEETGDKIFESNADVRHTMMYHNADQIKVIGVYDKLIEKAHNPKCIVGAHKGFWSHATGQCLWMVGGA